VLTLNDRVDSATISELERLLSAAVDDGHRHVVIDVLAVVAMPPQILTELRDALRVSNATTRLSVIAADVRLPWVRDLCEIDAVELHPTINAIPGLRPLRLPTDGTDP
jgi:hypothetical protein